MLVLECPDCGEPKEYKTWSLCPKHKTISMYQVIRFTKPEAKAYLDNQSRTESTKTTDNAL